MAGGDQDHVLPRGEIISKYSICTVTGSGLRFIERTQSEEHVVLGVSLSTAGRRRQRSVGVEQVDTRADTADTQRSITVLEGDLVIEIQIVVHALVDTHAHEAHDTGQRIQLSGTLTGGFVRLNFYVLLKSYEHFGSLIITGRSRRIFKRIHV